MNEIRVAHPLYFRGQFPFGEIRQDLGIFVNDFEYQEEMDEAPEERMWEDRSTARAYSLRFQPDESDIAIDSVVLSHETGLEVFLVAAGTFVGVEIAKFSLKATLEGIQRHLNRWWWQSRRADYEKIRDDVPEKLVESISVRTAHWQIALDGRFTPTERERILEHIGRILNPPTAIENFVLNMEDKALAGKVVMATRKVVAAEIHPF